MMFKAKKKHLYKLCITLVFHWEVKVLWRHFGDQISPSGDEKNV